MLIFNIHFSIIYSTSFSCFQSISLNNQSSLLGWRFKKWFCFKWKRLSWTHNLLENQDYEVTSERWEKSLRKNYMSKFSLSFVMMFASIFFLTLFLSVIIELESFIGKIDDWFLVSSRRQKNITNKPNLTKKNNH